MSKTGKRSKKRQPVLDSESLALMSLVERCRYADVEVAARRMLAKRQTHHLATKALSFALIGQAKFEEALPLLDHALEKWPQDAELHNNRGIVLSSLMRWDEALSNFSESLRLEPDDPEVLKNFGLAYGRMRRWQDAIALLVKAVEKHPGDYVDAIEALAMALANSGRLDEASVCYSELWGEQDDPKYLYELFSVSMRRCDWSDVDGKIELLRSRSDGFVNLLGNPFVSLFAPGLQSDEQRRIAESFARDFIPGHVLDDAPRTFGERSFDSERRLRVGYVSADYRVHPVGFVFPQVVELHDRSRFEIYGYSVGADDGSEIRKRFENAFDVFVDARDMSVRQLSGRIQHDEIDILVDLNGWTTDGRPEVFALRSAPVQANWLGYAGTMGHRHLADYLIGDPVVTPLTHGRFYSEALALLPDCYLPVDASFPLPSAPSREAQGLPCDAFVYCSFNSAYKYNPKVFDLWCSILNATPNSVLWLAPPPAGGIERLRDEARTRNLDPDRICFAKRVDARAEHLARLSLADLALDPFPYNSHSTGVEMLYVGVPMVSLLGDTFPSRVGASLLSAAKIPELITRTPEEYLSLATALYNDRGRLKALRDSISAEARVNLPIFDMHRLVGNVERLFEAMWQQYRTGRIAPVDGRLLAG